MENYLKTSDEFKTEYLIMDIHTAICELESLKEKNPHIVQGNIEFLKISIGKLEEIIYD